MVANQWRDRLEARQVSIYFASVCLAALAAMTLDDTERLEAAINPALAVMLFVTFLQVPLASLREAFKRGRFFGALLIANFVALPILVAILIQFAPTDPLVQLGILIVLLCPCIDYVVTFSHLGRADARLLLAATPLLLLAQMLLLPLWLGLFLGAQAAQLVQIGPFLDAFLWLIAMPLGLAALCQMCAARSTVGERLTEALGLLPVPATALVLLIVIAAVLPQLGPALTSVLAVAPIFAAFAVLAPILGWAVARQFKLEASAGRSVAFSVATRNSLVVLPLALAVPGAIPIVPAVIVTQTLIELAASLFYIRLMPRLGHSCA